MCPNVFLFIRQRDENVVRFRSQIARCLSLFEVVRRLRINEYQVGRWSGK